MPPHFLHLPPELVSAAEVTYNLSSGNLPASAPGGVIVGYGAVSIDTSSPGYAGATGTSPIPSFLARIAPSQLTGLISGTSGHLVLGAVICLAEDVPVADSLKAQLFTVKDGKVAKQQPDTRVPSGIASHIAEFARNAG